jgi:hypothetical protein
MLTLLLMLACGPAYSEVQKLDTIEAYESWVAANQNSPQRTLADIRIEELYLEKARTDKTLEAYDDYLDRYSEKGGELVKKARVEREEFLFTWAGEENTIASWEKFIAEYPSGGGNAGRKNRLEAKARIKVIGYQDNLDIGPVEVEAVNLAEDPDGPLNGWMFLSDVTNNGDKTLTMLSMELQYLDGEGKVIESDRWPLVAPSAPGNLPIEEEWKQPVKPGETRIYSYMDTAPEAPGWSKKARLVPTNVSFEGEEKEE